MRWLDSHCHLYDDSFDADRDDLLQQALDELEGLVVVADCIENSRRALALHRPRVWVAVGIHPHHACSADAAALDALRELAQEDGVRALGEIGLDYHYNFSPRDAQLAAFRAQLDLAIEMKLPVVIHSRECEDDMAQILDEYHARLTGGVMHCFSGDAPFARRCVDWGLHVSFAGTVTFKKAQPLRDAAVAVPLERLLVETDAPYLAPVPLRGRRCEPTFVRHTGAAIAALRDMPEDELADITTRNALRLFGEE